ncbi:MAG: sigma 54-interacting transcriptional regulator [Leptospirales bacterium]
MVTVQLISNDAEFRRKLKRKLKGDLDLFSSSTLKEGFRNLLKLSHELLVIDLTHIHGKIENIIHKVKTLNSQDHSKVALIFLAGPSTTQDKQLMSMLEHPQVESVHFLTGNNSEEIIGAISLSLKKFSQMLQYKQNYTLIKKQLEATETELTISREDKTERPDMGETSLGSTFSFTIGESEEALRLRRDLKGLPPHQVPILLTGKDKSESMSVVKYIYSRSKAVKKHPLLVGDFTEVPVHLQEFMLFGKNETTLPGFSPLAEGLLERTKKGVLYLPNIENLDWNLQARLLRTIREGHFYKQEQKINVRCRIIVYTPFDLEKSIDRGVLRQDFISHLAVHKIEVPQITQRKSDIPELIDMYAKKYELHYGKKISVDTEVKKVLMKRRWVEGIESFYTFLNQLFALCNEKVDLTLLDLAENNESSQIQTPSTDATITFTNSSFIREETKKQDSYTNGLFTTDSSINSLMGKKEYSLDELEREYIQSLLQKHHQNISECARVLGIARKTLYQKIKKYGLGSARSS